MKIKKKLKKVVSCFLAMVMATCMAFSTISARADYTYGNFTYTLSGYNVTITGYTGTGTSYVITYYLGTSANPIVAVKFTSSSSNDYVTKVTLTSGLITIGDYAFYNYTALKTINIPDAVTTM